jgi:hypothetical protein
MVPRSIPLLVGLVLLAIPLGFPVDVAGQEIPAAADRWNRAALEWIRLLQRGSFAEAGSRVDPAVPERAMGPEQLETLWGQLSAQLGELVSVQTGRVQEEGQYHLVDLPSTFRHQAVTLRVVLTDSLQVSGFFIRPPEPPPYETPDYADPERFREVEVTVGAEGWSLPGTLTLPESEGKVPAVVLVHGSGPNDRDETVGAYRPFKDLAWGLASRGIAVLRYDKRTRAYPSRVPSDIGLEEEVVEDALTALQAVRDQDAVDPRRVFLLGHSLGGILAPGIADRDGKLAGIAILAASARPFFRVLEGQLEYLAGLQSEAGARAALDSLIAVIREVEDGDVPDDQVVLGATPPYWREVADVKPVATARELSLPILVLQGGRDYQATTEDFFIWRRGLADEENVTTHLFPQLNHLFISGTGMATPGEYVSGQGHVAEDVVRVLAGWVQEVGG